MGIFMFITFASANLITIGAMWYGLMSQYRYNNGMVLGVHIPPEHAEEPGVTEQVTNARRKMKRFHIINLILIMALSILCFFNTALYVIIWIVWILHTWERRFTSMPKHTGNFMTIRWRRAGLQRDRKRKFILTRRY